MNDPLQNAKILVIDDDPEMLELLELFLCRAGAQTFSARNAQDGLREFYECRPNLVILDLMMPGIDGWECCERLRQLSDVPIMMLTALSKSQDIVRGLDCGADDYVAKPFDKQVLLARVRALLRRAGRPTSEAPPGVYDNGHLTIDLEGWRVSVRRQPVRLTPTEFKVLRYLTENASRVLTYEQILKRVWGPECQDSAQYVHVYIHRLRQKLEENPAEPRYLITEPGVGYRFEWRSASMV